MHSLIKWSELQGYEVHVIPHFLYTFTMIDSEQTSQHLTESGPELGKEKLRQDLIVGKFEDFLHDHSRADQRGKALSQLTITLRALNGMHPLQGSGFETEDAKYIANPEQTGFLQLGKIHSKGTANEGALDFYSRYAHYDASTKYTDLILVFKPETRQMVVSQDSDQDQIPAATWARIEKAGFSQSSVQGLRPAEDVLFLVFDPHQMGIKEIIQEYQQQYPELAHMMVSVDDFPDRFTEDGLLPGENKPENAQIDCVKLISEVMTWYGDINSYADFLIDQISPLLREEEKIRVIDLILEKIAVGVYGPLQESEHIHVLRKVADQISDQTLYNYLKLPRSFFRPEQYIPLIYMKYTDRQQGVPDQILAFIEENDDTAVYQKLATANAEEWEQIKEAAAQTDSRDRYKYFFGPLDHLDIDQKNAAAARRADLGVMLENVFLRQLVDEMVAKPIPAWKKTARRLWVGLTDPAQLDDQKTLLSKNFIQGRYSNFSEREYKQVQELHNDLYMLEEFLSSNWRNGFDAAYRPLRWAEGDTAARIKYAERLKDRVLSALGDKLTLLLEYYKKYPEGFTAERSE